MYEGWYPSPLGGGAWTRNPNWLADAVQRWEVEFVFSNLLYYHGEEQVWSDREWDDTVIALETHYELTSEAFRKLFPKGQIKVNAYATPNTPALFAQAKQWLEEKVVLCRKVN